MKVALSKQKDIHILTVSESLDDRTMQVLKAGITKLFKDGKNLMVLELSAIATLENSVIRELAQLNMLAKELSGEIVIGGLKPDVITTIQRFSAPPVITCFETRAAAIQFLETPPGQRNKDKDKKPTTPAAAGVATPGTPAPEAGPTNPLKKALEKKDEEIAQLRKQLLEKEQGELGKLKTEVEQLKLQNKTLEENITQLFIQRNDPPDAVSMNTKIKGLETQVEAQMIKLQELGGA